MRGIFAKLGFALVAALSFSGPALAAPQVLGVVATLAPVPLNCQGGTCQALLATFCLEESRPIPTHGNGYAPVGPITLIATRADGTVLRLDGRPYLRFASDEGFSSAIAELDPAMLAGLGAKNLAVSVGPKVSLVPLAVPGDPAPLSPAEVALAIGPMRDAAAGVFEAPGAARDAAQITARVLNGLPRDGSAATAGLWEATVASEVGANADPAGLARARELYDGCWRTTEETYGYAGGFGRCLERGYHDMMLQSNRQYWGLVGGS